MPVEPGLLDTNLIVYALTGEPAPLAGRATKLLREAESGRVSLVVPVAVVAEAVYVLGGRHFGFDRIRMMRALCGLLRTPGVVCDDLDAVLDALAAYALDGIDFVDGYLGARATAAGSCVWTFNRRHFEGRARLGELPA